MTRVQRRGDREKSTLTNLPIRTARLLPPSYLGPSYNFTPEFHLFFSNTKDIRMIMATNGEQQHLGVTKPITLAGPSEREIKTSEEMMDELRKQNTFESEEEARNREIVLGRISKLVKQFVHRVSIQNGLSEQAATASGGKIFTFGSYRLGVHSPGADIDTLLVVPKHVSRDDFFTTFEPMLREFEGVSEVAAVPEAYVPIIKTKISGIEIDFLCARLALATIPDDLELRDDNLLKNLDERCVRSLGGSRVTDEILRLVPNVPVFRDALRCIKLWAKRRAIYSNVMGFLGGVAWSMLVARICQLYPNQASGAIVQKFFTIIHQWQWPQPVLLKQIEGGPLNVRVWNPKIYPADRLHRMPIITPAYPAMCSTHNVTASTQEIMTQECKRGTEVVDSIMRGESQWSELFAKHDFFTRYRYYIQVVASAGSSEALKKWSGTVESKIRQLVMKLEFVDSLKLAHPFIKAFNHVFHCMNDAEVSAIGTGQFLEPLTKRTPEDIRDSEQGRSIWTASFFIGLEIAPKPAGTVGPQRLDITYPTNEFKKMAQMWDGYDNNTMALHLLHMKSAQLPNYVFEGGVRQPPKRTLKRTKSSKPTSGASEDMPANKKRRSSLNTTTAVNSSAAATPNASTPVNVDLAIHRMVSNNSDHPLPGMVNGASTASGHLKSPVLANGA